MKNRIVPIIAIVLFLAIGLTLWLTAGNIFYLLNFAYIGGFVSVGIYLLLNKKPYARNVSQFGVGLYMLIYLGVVLGENMQIEGFWFYLFSGVFQAAVIHYLVAKIGGPLLFGRGWCGYACWTAAMLDLLPHKAPARVRRSKLGFIRYMLFAFSLAFIGGLFLFRVEGIERIMYIAFIVGNALYYAVGIILAFAFRDNRAFCKYICPVAVFMKLPSYFSILRIKVAPDKCVSCGKCEKICPMDVAVTDNKRSRKNGTECILCLECVNNCPYKALSI